MCPKLKESVALLVGSRNRSTATARREDRYGLKSIPLSLADEARLASAASGNSRHRIGIAIEFRASRPLQPFQIFHDRLSLLGTRPRPCRKGYPLGSAP